MASVLVDAAALSVAGSALLASHPAGTESVRGELLRAVLDAAGTFCGGTLHSEHNHERCSALLALVRKVYLADAEPGHSSTSASLFAASTPKMLSLCVRLLGVPCHACAFATVGYVTTALRCEGVREHTAAAYDTLHGKHTVLTPDPTGVMPCCTACAISSARNCFRNIMFMSCDSCRLSVRSV